MEYIRNNQWIWKVIVIVASLALILASVLVYLPFFNQ